MINNIQEREGPAFNDDVWFTQEGRPIMGTVVGNVEGASLMVDGKMVDQGKIEFVPTIESGHPSRATIFVGKGMSVVMEQRTIKS